MTMTKISSATDDYYSSFTSQGPNMKWATAVFYTL